MLLAGTIAIVHATSWNRATIAPILCLRGLTQGITADATSGTHMYQTLLVHVRVITSPTRQPGEYYVHVLTAKTQSGYEDGITYYDTRTVPGRFEIGEPGSGGGDGEPDLRVVMEWLEVLPAGNGARFGLSGAVENEGDGPSPATTLRYYRSTNETISRNDTEVATHPVPALAAGEDTGIPANLSITLDMPTTPGTHYYGACVDSVPGESDTGNNCDGAGTLTVEEPDPPTGDDHGNTTGDATVVSGISTTQGELEQGGDVDYFRIDLDHPGRLTVETTGPTDTYGTLSGPNGLIGENDDAGEGANFLINANVEAGAHYVAVRGFNSSTTGSYTLVVDYEPEAVDPIGPTATHTVPLVTSASRTDQQGFVRVINRSDRAGTVSIRAIDDAGNRSQPVTLSMGASATRHFNSGDLEDGNSAKGLSDGVGRRPGRLAARIGERSRYPGACLHPHPGRLPRQRARHRAGIRWRLPRCHIQSGQQRSAAQLAAADQPQR